MLFASAPSAMSWNASWTFPPWAMNSANPTPASSRKLTSALVPSFANSEKVALSWVAATFESLAVRFARAAVTFRSRLLGCRYWGDLEELFEAGVKSVYPSGQR